MRRRHLELLGVPAPASKKNKRRIFRVSPRGKSKSSKLILMPSKAAEDAEKSIHALAVEQLGRVMCEDQDVALEVVFHAKSKTVDIRAHEVGEKPNGFMGRRRDLHGMIETIADALNGAAYTDDRQVVSVTMIRLLD